MQIKAYHDRAKLFRYQINWNLTTSYSMLPMGKQFKSSPALLDQRVEFWMCMHKISNCLVCILRRPRG